MKKKREEEERWRRRRRRRRKISTFTIENIDSSDPDSGSAEFSDLTMVSWAR